MRCRVHGSRVVAVDYGVTTDAQDRDLGRPRLRSQLTLADLEEMTEQPDSWAARDRAQYDGLRNMNKNNRRAFAQAVRDRELEPVAVPSPDRGERQTDAAQFSTLKQMNIRNKRYWEGPDAA